MEITFPGNLKIGGGVRNFNALSEPISPTIDQIRDTETDLTISGRSIAAGSQFRWLKNNIPTVRVRENSVASSILAQNAASVFEKKKGIPSSAERNTLYGERFLAEQASSFERAAGYLSNLQNESENLKKNDPIPLKKASVNKADVLTAKADNSAKNGKYTVTVQQLSKGDEVASSSEIDPSAELGLSGEIKINGYAITVESIDTLASIAAKINFGEDRNFNGKLDPNEDINENGQLDVLTSKSQFAGDRYLKPYYHDEDLNDNGAIDADEDVNDNDMLDGNSEQTKARAIIFENQLILISDNPGDIALSLKDPDGILESIGVLVRNDETGFVSTNNLDEASQAAQKAWVLINGEPAKLPENRLENALAGVSLELKSVGDAEITVKNDAVRAREPIVNFAASYNSSINFLNLIISGNGAISENLRLQSIYSQTVTSLFSSPPVNTGRFNSLNEIGININKNEPDSIDQSAFENIAFGRGLNIISSAKSDYSFSKRLDRIGINSEENFSMQIDKSSLDKSFSKDIDSVNSLLNFVAGRLEENLSLHLQPDYGTIQFQQAAINSYRENGEDPVNSLSRKLQESKIVREQTESFFDALG